MGRKIFDEADIESSQAFCMLPWVHLYISTYGTVTPCCVTPWDEKQAFGNINKKPIKEIWNDKGIRKMRSQMLKDKKDARCWQCYENEANGLKSHRQIANLCYEDKVDWVAGTKLNGYSADSKPIYWDIRISNLCNFKCRICGHFASSKWFEDAKAINQQSFDKRLQYSMNDFADVLNQLEEFTPELEEVYFAGGEPLIMEEHYRILDLLIEKERFDIKLRYSTNFSQTVFKGRDVFQDWKLFKDLNIHASLDGSDKKGELQRSGQKWLQALENRKRLLEICPHADFTITSTISVFNVLHLPDFHRNWVGQHLIDVDDFIPHVLMQPDIYNIKILPQSLKDEVDKKYKDHLLWLKSFPTSAFLKLEFVINEFENTLTIMHSEDWSHLIPQFLSMTEKLDALRGENTRAVFPELEPLFS
ncbi:MAG: twitch domain-containing radical SAM protein [Bacteroidota bacterium]